VSYPIPQVHVPYYMKTSRNENCSALRRTKLNVWLACVGASGQSLIWPSPFLFYYQLRRILRFLYSHLDYTAVPTEAPNISLLLGSQVILTTKLRIGRPRNRPSLFRRRQLSFPTECLRWPI